MLMPHISSRPFSCAVRVCAAAFAIGAIGASDITSASAVGDANESACPNESSPGFRTYLPDCRAYELVTPPNKGGALVKAEGFASAAIAADGSSLLGASTGAFAGLTSDELPAPSGTADYRFTRTGNGWVTSALDPFQTQLMSSGVEDSIWAPDVAGSGADHFSLVHADGSVSDIGPVWPPALGPNQAPGNYNIFPPYSVLGAASNASNGVVFTIVKTKFGPSLIEKSSLYWPFDMTIAESSLYEYTGTNSVEPSLVGVGGGAGSTTLISQCGAYLGSSQEEYNAVSAHGETVFFDAEAGGCVGENRNHELVTGSGPPVSELYARIAGSKTVAISEPSRNDCEACETAPAAMRPAVFRGASEDGSRVFFTTEQELLAGQKGTNLYEYDFDAPEHHKIALVSSGASEPQVQGVSRISLDGSHAYFVASGALSATPNNGGQKAQAGADNLYVYVRDESYPSGHIAFIALLCSGAGKSREIDDPQCSSSLGAGVGDEELWAVSDQGRPAQATPDGQFLVFTSYGDLTADDTSDALQVFRYDSLTGNLVRISIGQDGYNNNGNAMRDVSDASVDDNARISPQDYGYGARGGAIARTMSDDGSDVFFQSPVGLTPQALNLVQVDTNSGDPLYAQNVYEYHDGRVSLISDGRDTARVLASEEILIGTSASGGDVFFRSGDQLVPQDTDTQVDFYDARIDGGFPAPAAPASCEGEGCQAPSSATPVFGAPVSANFAGSGNLTPPAITPVAKPNPLTRAQELTKALKACKKKPKKKRASCKAQARKKYGSKSKAANGTKSKASKGKRGNK